MLTSFKAILLSLLILPLGQQAFAQDSGRSAKVLRQRNCVLTLSNESSLQMNDKVVIRKSDGLTASAVVRKINPNKTAMAMLANKFCKNDYVGAQVSREGDNTMASDAGGEPSSGRSSRSALPEGVEYDSSAHNRIKYKVTTRVGLGWMFTPGATVGVGYNFSHQFLGELAVDGVNTNLLNVYKYKRVRVGALGSYYPGNSFYSVGGLIFENFSSGLIGGKVDDSGLSFADDAFKADISQIQGQLGIGNRWTLDRFIIGAEWVGLSVPLFNLSEKFSKIEGYPEGEFDSAKTANKKFADTFSFRLLNFYLGFAI